MSMLHRCILLSQNSRLGTYVCREMCSSPDRYQYRRLEFEKEGAGFFTEMIELSKTKRSSNPQINSRSSEVTSLLNASLVPFQIT